MVQKTIVDIIAIGKISSYLCLKDTSQQQLIRQRTMNGNQWQQIVISTFFLEQRYFINPTDPNLTAAANYVYYICGKYAGIAASVIGSGTIVQFVNNSGQLVNVSWEKAQFVIGNASQSVTAGAVTPQPGDTSVLFPYPIMPKSELITYQLTQVPEFPSTEPQYFNATYGSNSTLYTFAQPLYDGYELAFQFARIVGPASSGASPAPGPVIGLQSVAITVPATGNTLTVTQLGTFVFALIGGIPYANDPAYITQSGDVLDATAIGGWVAGTNVIIFYNP